MKLLGLKEKLKFRFATGVSSHRIVRIAKAIAIN